MSRIYYNPDWGSSVYLDKESNLFVVLYGVGYTTHRTFLDESLAIEFANAPFDYDD